MPLRLGWRQSRHAQRLKRSGLREKHGSALVRLPACFEIVIHGLAWAQVFKLCLESTLTDRLHGLIFKWLQRFVLGVKHQLVQVIVAGCQGGGQLGLEQKAPQGIGLHPYRSDLYRLKLWSWQIGFRMVSEVSATLFNEFFQTGGPTTRAFTPDRLSQTLEELLKGFSAGLPGFTLNVLINQFSVLLYQRFEFAPGQPFLGNRTDMGKIPHTQVGVFQ